MTAPEDQPPEQTPDPGGFPLPEPIYCVIGETVREVRIWTVEEWERLDPTERPSPAEYVPGLRWLARVIQKPS